MIQIYKNRVIDYTERVFVYRKLFKNSPRVMYSIKQKGLVVAHGYDFKLHFVLSNIDRIGQIRARNKKVRNVHAYLHGFLAMDCELNIEGKQQLHYNPFVDDCFWYDKNGEKQEIHYSTETILTTKGVFCNIQTTKEENELVDRVDYIHEGIFQYTTGKVNLPNWIQGTINGVKSVLWWYDGIVFQPNTQKEIICICDAKLIKRRMPFLIDGKIIGYFSPSIIKIHKYKFPKF